MERKLRLISPLERALHLKKLAALGDVAPSELATLALQLTEHAFDKGAIVYRPGERVTLFHILVEGRIRVRGGEHGESTVGRGETLGQLSLLARSEAGLDAVAETDAVTLAMDTDTLNDVFEDDFTILHNQIRDLAARTLKARKQIPDGTYLAPAESLEQEGADATDQLELVGRLLYLRRGVFKQANLQALISLASRLVRRDFTAGTRLWSEGEATGFMYALIRGRVRCRLADGTHFIAGPGYPLGNLESQCGAPRWYEAVTETDVIALRAETDLFVDTIEQHFDMAIDFVEAMATGLIARLQEMREEAAAAA